MNTNSFSGYDDESSVLEVLNLSSATLDVIYQFLRSENLSAINAIAKLLDIVSADIIGPFYQHFKNLLQFKSTPHNIRDKMGQDIDIIQAVITPFRIFRKIFKGDSTFGNISEVLLVDKMRLERSYEMIDHMVSEHRTLNSVPPLFRIYEDQFLVYSDMNKDVDSPDRRFIRYWKYMDARPEALEKYHPILKGRVRKEKLRMKLVGISSYLANTRDKLVCSILNPPLYLSSVIMKALRANGVRNDNAEREVGQAQTSLIFIPQKTLEAIFSYLSCENLASVRGVCRNFDVLASSILKKEFENFRKKVLDKIEVLSEQFISNLSEYVDISAAVELDILLVIELSLACLHFSLGQYIEKNLGCFFTGKLLDQGHELMQMAADHKFDLQDPKIENFIQNCRKAIIYFKRHIEPEFTMNNPSYNSVLFYKFKRGLYSLGEN